MFNLAASAYDVSTKTNEVDVNAEGFQKYLL